MDFINTCAAGLEPLVEHEITGWGGSVAERRRGAVHWSGDLEHGYQACLWSRFSSRVIMVLKRFEIGGDADLYEGTGSVDWSGHLTTHSSFAVDCVLSGGGPVTNSMFGALRVKDGIADQFRNASGLRPSVKTDQPDVQVYVHICGAAVILGLDLSGIALHRRGYRAVSGPTPLKESLAAAIVAMSGWDGSATLLDPMCGSGTLLIEAALMYGDSAPGLGRSYFGMFGWQGHDSGIWDALVDDAIKREDLAQDKRWPKLIGFDGDETAVEAARKNIGRAGLEERITVGCRELSRLENQFGRTGHLISNPPYGERLSDKASVKYLYRCLGQHFQSEFPDWRITMFTAAPDFSDQFRIDSPKTLKIFNGPLPCRLISGTPKKKAAGRDRADRPLQIGQQQTGDELSNRIIKNFRQIKPLADKYGLESYRVYDRDLPQYNVTIDLLGASILVTEFTASSKVDRQTVDERFAHVTRCVRSLFQVGRERVYVSRRLKRPRSGIRKQSLEIVEDNRVAVLELPSGYGAGFPLDQVLVRRYIADTIGRGRFLSVFDGGGLATVAAVSGGATMTTTIAGPASDGWCIAVNFNRNGLLVDKHRIVEQSPAAWFEQNRQPYDLIYVNPRRLSYAKKRSAEIDLIRDHHHIIDQAVSSLAPGGTLIFSTLLPTLKLDQRIRRRYGCRDISSETAGALVGRQRQHFQCWRIERRPQPA